MTHSSETDRDCHYCKSRWTSEHVNCPTCLRPLTNTDTGPFTMSRYVDSRALHAAMIAHIDRLDAENKRLREALEKISTFDDRELPDDVVAQSMSLIARETLKAGTP